jgi:predicted nucleic acid-binding protein
MLYFDASYIVRLYVSDPGWEKVRALAQTDALACSILGQAETIGAFHRKFREGTFTRKDLLDVLKQFEADCAAKAYGWLPLSHSVVDRLAKGYASLTASTHLRAADGIHLASAAENGFREIYSNDAHLLAASANFGLSARNVI